MSRESFVAGPSVRIIADSIADTNDRLTSVEITMHRLVLAEVNTHASASRNSASSRAIPARTQFERYRDNPAWPVSLPCEQRGMSGGAELVAGPRVDAMGLLASIHAATSKLVGDYLDSHPDPETRMHKSVLNRPMEPFQYHTVLYTASKWRNFLAQRNHPDAQPEFEIIARLIAEALDAHEPMPLQRGVWHLPYVGIDEIDELRANGFDPRQISAARCARTSYMTQNGQRDPAADVALFERLVGSNHWSPLEHIATPDPNNVTVVTIRDPDANDALITDSSGNPVMRRVPILGKWAGWQQYRHIVEARTGWNSHI